MSQMMMTRNSFGLSPHHHLAVKGALRDGKVDHEIKVWIPWTQTNKSELDKQTTYRSCE